MLRLAHAIDRVNGAIGRATLWLLLASVLLAAATAILRYVGRPLGVALVGNWMLEGQWYLFAAVFLLAGAYALSQNAHVRVDVLYGRLSTRGKGWVDLVGGVLFLLPFCAFVIWASWPAVEHSWAIRERSPDPGGLPRYPIKTLVPIGLALLAIQGVAEIIKAVARIRGEAPPPPRDALATEEGL